ncbi:hypothetical protein VIGAN_02191100 [Vigna angularis var. angularis]|uniref:Uncharacterized protein n=1 Tax=Vigna angularis var. angularis TaxID=157739 RepID=A0A0S3RF98_PHAAN|nr:hypothetical protein VIGAN_02191100 [Vigna angularis var. angularis]
MEAVHAALICLGGGAFNFGGSTRSTHVGSKVSPAALELTAARHAQQIKKEAAHPFFIQLLKELTDSPAICFRGLHTRCPALEGQQHTEESKGLHVLLKRPGGAWRKMKGFKRTAAGIGGPWTNEIRSVQAHERRRVVQPPPGKIGRIHSLFGRSSMLLREGVSRPRAGVAATLILVFGF